MLPRDNSFSLFFGFSHGLINRITVKLQRALFLFFVLHIFQSSNEFFECLIS